MHVDVHQARGELNGQHPLVCEEKSCRRSYNLSCYVSIALVTNVCQNFARNMFCHCEHAHLSASAINTISTRVFSSCHAEACDGSCSSTKAKRVIFGHADHSAMQSV